MKFHAKTAMERKDAILSENEIAKQVVNICFEIHSLYGPGLFESVYEEIFCYELNKFLIPFARQIGESYS